MLTTVQPSLGGPLQRLLGPGGVVELALGVVVAARAGAATACPRGWANSSIGMSPLELPAASIGRRPMRLQMRIGFCGPSSR